MNFSDDQIKQIERFFLGQMNAEEKESFQLEIDSSKELQEFIDAYIQSDSFIGEKDWVLINQSSERTQSLQQQFESPQVKEFSNKLLEIRKAQVQKENKPPLNLTIFISMAVAASVALFFFLTPSEDISSEELFAEYSSWENLPGLTYKGDDQAQALSELETTFKVLKDYEASKRLALEISKNSDSFIPDVVIYLGVSQLELGETNECIKTFKSLLESEALDFHKGYWYTSLAYLKSGQEDKAIETLQLIASNQGYFQYKEAVKILNQLE